MTIWVYLKQEIATLRKIIRQKFTVDLRLVYGWFTQRLQMIYGWVTGCFQAQMDKLQLIFRKNIC